MSLFGGLFGGGGAGQSSLFSKGNKFKVHEDHTAATTTDIQNELARNSKKRKQAAGDTQSGNAAEPAAKTATDAATGAVAATEGKKKKRKVEKLLPQEQKQLQQRDKHSKRAAADTAAAGIAPKPDKHRTQQGKQQQQQQQEKKNKHISIPDAVPDSSSSGSDDDADSDVADDTAGIQQEQQQRQKVTEDAVVAAEKLARTIFVGNLPVTIKRKAIARLFVQYGAVDSLRMRSVPLDLESKKKLPRKAAVIKGVVSNEGGGTNAYIVFKEATSATAALAANMTEVEGHHIRVDRAAPPASASGGPAGVVYEPARSVFVGNLDFKVTEEELIRTFSNGEAQPELAGAVEAVRVVRDSKTNIGKGIAYVLFKTKAAAHAALRLDGSKLRERAMRVSRADKKVSAGGAAAAKQGGRFGGKQDGKMGGKFARKGPAGRNGPAGALGVRQGGVRKHSGATAADWQGLRTKGKGAGFRAAQGSKAKASGNHSSRGSRKDAKATPAGAKSKGTVNSKRPAVAARKAKAKAAAAKAKEGGLGR